MLGPVLQFIQLGGEFRAHWHRPFGRGCRRGRAEIGREVD
jgi:hypothetical protein